MAVYSQDMYQAKTKVKYIVVLTVPLNIAPRVVSVQNTNTSLAGPYDKKEGKKQRNKQDCYVHTFTVTSPLGSVT
jgi:hypothetical protein